MAQSKEIRATVYVETAYLRETASMSATVVGSLTKGTSVVVLERRDDWTKVSVGKTVGWVRASTLTTSAEAAPAPAQQAPTVPEPPRREPARAPEPAPTRPASPPAVAPVAPSVSREASREASPAPRRLRDQTAGQGISLGVLGSATPREASFGVVKANHVAVLPLLLLQTTYVGVYAAPEFGNGADYQSIMLGGGVTVRLIAVGPLEARLMGGYTTYAVQSTLKDASDEAKWDFAGPSAGGLVSLRLFNSVRLGYRGQYVFGLGDNSTAKFQRHAFGLIF